jgi:predicted MFS family arabinose efflux permease
MPSLVSVVVASAEEHQRSSALATFTMFLDLAVAVGGPVFGLVAAGTSYEGAFWAGAGTRVLALVVVHTWLGRRIPKGPIPAVDPVPTSAVDTV